MIKRLLIIDDDKQIASLLAKILSRNNYSVDCAFDTKKADELLAVNHYDLIILDVLMPGEKGTEYILRKKKEFADIPVIMLSALGDVDDEVTGLVSGADDYMTKPFEPSVLLVKIDKFIRKNNKLKQNNKIIQFGDFKYDLSSNVLWKNSAKIHLTTSQQKLLHLFLNNIGEALTRDKIKAKMQNISDRSVDTQINRLRQIIETAHNKPVFLKTIRHKGYIFHI